MHTLQGIVEPFASMIPTQRIIQILFHHCWHWWHPAGENRRQVILLLLLSHHLWNTYKYELCNAVAHQRFAKTSFSFMDFSVNGISERDRKFVSRCRFDAHIIIFNQFSLEAYVNNVVPNRITVRHRWHQYMYIVQVHTMCVCIADAECILYAPKSKPYAVPIRI